MVSFYLPCFKVFASHGKVGGKPLGASVGEVGCGRSSDQSAVGKKADRKQICN
jgi:hypothetical protein